MLQEDNEKEKEGEDKNCNEIAMKRKYKPFENASLISKHNLNKKMKER